MALFLITNKRFIYSGQIKTAQVDLRKIIQIDPMDDGIGLHKENKEKTQYFTWTYFDNAWFVRGDKNAVRRASSRVKEIELSENGRRYNVPLTGEVLKAVIESAARRYSK